MADRFRKRYKEKTPSSFESEEYKKKLDPTRGSSSEQKKIKKLARLYYKEVLKPEEAFGTKAALYSDTTVRNLIVFLVLFLIAIITISSISYSELRNNNIPTLESSEIYSTLSIVIVTMTVTLLLNYFFILKVSAKVTNIVLFGASTILFAIIYNNVNNADNYKNNPVDIPDEAKTISRITLAGAVISGIAALVFLGIAIQATPEEDVMKLVLEKNEQERDANILKKIREHQDEAVRSQQLKWEQEKLNNSQKGAVMDQAIKLYLDKNKKEKEEPKKEETKKEETKK